MMLKRVRIENFKGIRDCEIDLCDLDGKPRRRFTIVGDNGTGKTSVLQAIGTVLAQATGRRHWAWPGLLLDRLGTLGPTTVELQVYQPADELDWVHWAYDAWHEWKNQPPTMTHTCAELTLTYRHGEGLRTQDGYFPEQLFAWAYAKELHEAGNEQAAEALRHLGRVYWFSQDRTLASVLHGDAGLVAGRPGGVSDGVDELREALLGGWLYHSSEGGREPDIIAELENRLAAVFAEVRFAGPRPRRGRPELSVSEYYFMLRRNGSEYDIAEMSSGEQAVFPLLYAFAKDQIAHSVILVDELELHLHPPAQQALYNYLLKLGPDCQFILTTHSEALVDIIPDDHMKRLEGGRRCL